VKQKEARFVQLPGRWRLEREKSTKRNNGEQVPREKGIRGGKKAGAREEKEGTLTYAMEKEERNRWEPSSENTTVYEMGGVP